MRVDIDYRRCNLWGEDSFPARSTDLESLRDSKVINEITYNNLKNNTHSKIRINDWMWRIMGKYNMIRRPDREKVTIESCIMYLATSSIVNSYRYVYIWYLEQVRDGKTNNLP